MGKIYKLTDKTGNVLYPMTIGDAIAVDGATLTSKITTEATQSARGMMSASDKTKLDGISDGATAVSESTVSGWGFTKNIGTITSVKINGKSVASSGEADLGNVFTYTGSKPTTLEGFGITDAKIENGTITLGSNTITPLTDDSTYVTLSGTQSITNKTYNGYTLGAACAKAVDATVSAESENLPTSKAVAAYVDGALVSVLKYKGTVKSNSELPASHAVGDVYVVAVSGTFAGQSCEVGDYIICKTKGTTANNEHWDIVNGENQVSSENATLAWGSAIKIATVDGTEINVSLPANPASNKADKATTLDGYGITDAKIENGTITLGSNTITPLTTSSTLDATKLSGTIPSGCYTDTTYESKDAVASGTEVSLVTTGEKASWNAKYVKPTGGIPKSDLASAVQTSLGKADTALQAGAYDNALAGKQSKITASGILKGNGTGSVSAATAGTDYLAPVTAVTDTVTDSQIIKSVTQTTEGQITVTKSDFTIETSVPANAKFTDTTYESKAAAINGTAVSLVTTGEKASWNAKQNALSFKTAFNSSTNKVVTESDILYATQVKDTEYTDDTILTIIQGK